MALEFGAIFRIYQINHRMRIPEMWMQYLVFNRGRRELTRPEAVLAYLRIIPLAGAGRSASFSF